VGLRAGRLKIFRRYAAGVGKTTRKYRLDTTSFLLDSELNELPTLRQTLEKFVSDEACLEHLGDSLAGWSALPQCRYPTHVIRFHPRGRPKGAETLPLLIRSPSIKRDSRYYFPRYLTGRYRLVAGDYLRIRRRGESREGSERMLGVSYETAWHMRDRIRER